MKKQTANDWLKTLEIEIGGKAEQVPDGWKTMAQIHKELKMTIGEAETFIKRATKLGKIQKKKFRASTEGVGVRDVWHYNIKK